MMPPPIVLCVWEDAKTLDSGAWAENSPAEFRPHLVSQVGYLVHQSDQGIILTQAWHPELIAARDQIPAGMIRSVTFLTERPSNRKRAAK
jgi:hypothetical protein